MNTVYRLVWNIRLQALVAVSELCRQRSKLGQTLLLGSVSIALPISLPTFAIDICTGGTTTVSGAVAGTDNCELANSEGIDIISTGILSPNSSAAITGGASATAGSISNSGLISTGAYTGSTIDIIVSTINSITNSGTIEGSGSTNGHGAIRIAPQSAVNNGIINTSTGIISGATAASDSGILIGAGTVNGGIDNSGLMQSDAAAITLGSSAMGLGGGTLSGGLTNRSGGRIAGQTNGISSNGGFILSGGLTNAGEISSGTPGQAISLRDMTLDFIDNQAGGVMSGGDGAALFVATVSGSVTNSGTVTGSAGKGVKIFSSTITGQLLNDLGATIQGEGAGVQFDGATIIGGFVNRGTIGTLNGGGNAGFGVELSNNSALSLTNSGAINGGINGILLSFATITGAVTNEAGGVISGIDGSGIRVYNSSNLVGGLSNAGTISSSVDMGIYINSSSACKRWLKQPSRRHDQWRDLRRQDEGLDHQ